MLKCANWRTWSIVMENYKIKMMNNSIYHYPTINLLDSASAIAQDVDLEQLEEQQKHIIDVLRTFCIPINEIKYTLSPSAIRYEIKPKSGQLYAKVRKNEHDISLCLSPMGVRIMSPVPGRNVMVIEIANPAPYTYQLKDIIEATTLKNDDMDLPCAIGKTIDDEVFIFDLAKMPHLLIGGATGQGKTVCLHDIIMSLLFKKSPQELNFVLIDPKKVEFEIYYPLINSFLMKIQGCKHPIITDVDEAVLALNSLCELMNKRFDLLKHTNVRNINEYNEKITNNTIGNANGYEYMPYIVVIIDEFADLKMIAEEDIEMPLVRLAQLARSVGIHLIIATQRPTYNIITGNISANFPASIAFKVATQSDSRVIIHNADACKLLGKGDMLFSHISSLTRVQCAYVDKKEINQVVSFIAQQEINQ